MCRREYRPFRRVVCDSQNSQQWMLAESQLPRPVLSTTVSTMVATDLPTQRLLQRRVQLELLSPSDVALLVYYRQRRVKWRSASQAGDSMTVLAAASQRVGSGRVAR